MIFRKSDGTIVEINRYDFKNDVLYYKKLAKYAEEVKEKTVENENKNKNECKEKK